jgi:hypothetical protein
MQLQLPSKPWKEALAIKLLDVQYSVHSSGEKKQPTSRLRVPAAGLEWYS